MSFSLKPQNKTKLGSEAKEGLFFDQRMNWCELRSRAQALWTGCEWGYLLGISQKMRGGFSWGWHSCPAPSPYRGRRQWHPTPVLLPGKSHGRRSLVGYSPWGREESYMTERLYFHFSLSCIGEGNGNPLQCSCLENHRDGGACWAAGYGVAQSRTRLL